MATVEARIRPVPMEQSDLGFHCLLEYLGSLQWTLLMYNLDSLTVCLFHYEQQLFFCFHK